MNKTIDMKYMVCSAVALAFMLGFKFLPPFGGITATGMNVIGIFIGMIVAYCTIGAIWPSILALLLLGLSEGYTVPGVFMGAFGHNVVIYMFILLLIGKALEDSGITQIFANWLVSRKIARNRPWVLSTLILLAAYVCSLFIGMIAPAIICWNIVYDICKKFGYVKGDKWPTNMVFTIMFLATVAAFVFPFQLGVVGNFGILTQASGGTVVNNFIPYLMFTSIMCALIFVGCVLVGKFFLKIDTSPLMGREFEEVALVFNKKQKAILILFALFVVGLFLPSFLPPSLLADVLNALGSTGWSALIVALGVFIKVEGGSLFNFQSLASGGVVWDIILMMASIFTMSAALTASETGFSAFILSTLTPLFNGASPMVFIVLITVITCVLANLINNIAVCAILIPIAYMLSLDVGANILVAVTLMNALGNLGFLLPSSSPQAAMIYNQEWANPKLIKPYALIEMGVATVITIACVPLAQAIIG